MNRNHRLNVFSRRLIELFSSFQPGLQGCIEDMQFPDYYKQKLVILIKSHPGGLWLIWFCVEFYFNTVPFTCIFCCPNLFYFCLAGISDLILDQLCFEIRKYWKKILNVILWDGCEIQTPDKNVPPSVRCFWAFSPIWQTACGLRYTAAVIMKAWRLPSASGIYRAERIHLVIIVTFVM